MKVIVGITGASGSIYACRLLEVLAKAGHETHVVVTASGQRVLDYECNMTNAKLSAMVTRLYDNTDIGAAIASGSFKTDAMVIVPCSMKTAGCIANGITDNLLTRAADVMLKEQRKLIVVPRETPMHAIHLANLLKLSQTGAQIMPACPGFYHLPQNLAELTDMMVGKICDQLGIEHNLFARWQGEVRSR